MGSVVEQTCDSCNKNCTWGLPFSFDNWNKCGIDRGIAKDKERWRVQVMEVIAIINYFIIASCYYVLIMINRAPIHINFLDSICLCTILSVAAFRIPMWRRTRKLSSRPRPVVDPWSGRTGPGRSTRSCAATSWSRSSSSGGDFRARWRNSSRR